MPLEFREQKKKIMNQSVSVLMITLSTYISEKAWLGKIMQKYSFFYDSSPAGLKTLVLEKGRPR